MFRLRTRKRLKQCYFVIMLLIIIFLTSVFVFKFHTASQLRQLSRYTVETETKNDTLIDLKKFHFLIDSRTTCDECKSRFLLIILIHTAISNIEKRTAIRETWGKQSECVKVLYVMGITKDKNAAKKVHEENEKYHDVIQGNFIDTYRNNSYKHIMVLKWAAVYCRQAKYIVKTDDDIVVNVGLLYDKLATNHWAFANTSITCPVFEYSQVLRNPSKWAVTQEEYPGNATYYPKYCSGFFIIYSAHAVRKLLEESSKERYFWIDDVYVTGILAKRAGLKYIDINNWYLSKADYLLSKGPQSFIYGPMNQSPESIYKIWSSLKSVLSPPTTTQRHSGVTTSTVPPGSKN